MEYKILVVDDDRSITNLLQTELEQAGYVVSVAYDGNAADVCIRDWSRS